MKKFLCLTTMLLAVICFTAGQVAAATTTYTCAVMDDTRLDQRDPDINNGTGTTIKIVGDPLSAEVVRGIIRFNIPSFITSSQIQSATLHMIRKNGDDIAINIHPVTPPAGTKWYEKDIFAPDTTQLIWGATWNEAGGDAAGYAWTTPGGDYDAAQYASATIGSTNDIDITTLVTDNLDTIRRYGILLKMQDETLDEFCSLYSRDNAGSNPYLELVVDLGLPEGTYLCPTISDTYLDEGDPTYNFNWKSRVLLSWHPTYKAARGLWKFEIPEGIAGDSIESATFYLSGSVHALSLKSFDVDMFALDASFNEETICWDTLAGAGYDTSVSSTGHLPGTLNPEQTNWYAALDVTTLLVGNVDKVRDNGMLVKLITEAGTTKLHQNIASREAYDDTDVPAYMKSVVEPDVVTLASFDVIPGNGKATIMWTTSSEINNAGYNVYRAEKGGEYVKINSAIIAAEGSATKGASYKIVDTGLKNRTKYSYKLEDVDRNGTTTMHEPKSATPRLLYIK